MAGPSRRAGWIAGGVAIVAVAGLVGLVVWALVSRGHQPAPPPPPPFSRYRAGWESAMRKAGIRAVFPDGPVDVTELRSSGRRSFEATFTAEEVTALMGVYPFATEIRGQEVSVSGPVVEFGSAGIGSLSGKLAAGGSAYAIDITAPLTFAGHEIRSPGPTSLAVEGFTIRGTKRRQAGEAVLEYLNRYLREAPGLAVEEAAIVPGGVVVRGFAAVSLENPAAPPPAPSP